MIAQSLTQSHNYTLKDSHATVPKHSVVRSSRTQPATP